MGAHNFNFGPKFLEISPNFAFSGENVFDKKKFFPTAQSFGAGQLPPPHHDATVIGHVSHHVISLYSSEITADNSERFAVK